ncbi:MAG: hypothetical protein AB8F94_18015 [Saprospiraceae bacterium]
MKTNRTILLSLFLSINFSMLAQLENPIHWVVGINAGSEYLYPNTETNPIGITSGIFQQFSIKDFSVSAGITFGQREIYDKVFTRVNASNYNFTSTRIRNYREKSLTTDIFIKYYPPFIQSKQLIFVGLGVQFKSPMKVTGETTTMSSRSFFPDTTYKTNGIAGKKGYRLGIGMDYYMNEKVFFSGKVGLNFFLNQTGSEVNPKGSTYTGGSNNVFLEIQFGYNFKKSNSLYRG